MENTVFGVNTAEVKAQVEKLVEVYKTKGKTAVLKEWGHKMNSTLYGREALIAKFLKVLFEVKNDEFINEVLNEEDTSNLFYKACRTMLCGRENPKNWNCMLIGYQEELAYAWAVYNLPILQEVMDCIIDGLDKHPAYLNDCYALEDMLDDIKDNGGLDKVPCFQSYVSPYIVEYLEDYDLENLIFLNDEGEVREVDLDYLEYVWNQFCNTALIEDILLDYYCSFMIEAVREVLNHANV